MFKRKKKKHEDIITVEYLSEDAEETTDESDVDTSAETEDDTDDVLFKKETRRGCWARGR